MKNNCNEWCTNNQYNSYIWICKVLDTYDLTIVAMSQQIWQLSFAKILWRNYLTVYKSKNEKLAKQVEDMHIILKQYNELKEENESCL